MTRDLWIVVPVKPLRDSKTRLAGTLDGGQRRALVRRLLRQTLRTVRHSHVATGCLVVSRDPQVLHLARGAGAATLREIHPSLNAALAQAAGVLSGAMLVLPLDLPRLAPASLLALTRRSGGRAAAIAPDRARRGTNALLLQPPDLIRCAFGPGSFARHVEALRQVGVTPRVVTRGELALDIDTPADLRAWLGR